MSPRSSLATLLLFALPACGALGLLVRTEALVVLDKSDATARVFDPDSRALRTVLPTGAGPHEVVCRGGLAVVTDYGEQEPGHTLTVLDLAAGSVVRTIELAPHERPHGILWLDERRVLVTSEASEALLRVDVESGAVEAVLSTGAKGSHMVALAPDGARAFAANMGSNTVSAIDLTSGELLAQIPVGHGPEAIDVSPGGREVWVGNRFDDTLTVLDARTLEPLSTLPCAKFPIRLKFTPDGERVLVSCARSADVAVFDARGRSEVLRIPMQLTTSEQSSDYFLGRALGDGPLPIGILIEPSGGRAWIANTNADAVTEIDLDAWSVVARIPTGRQPDGLAWSSH